MGKENYERKLKIWAASSLLSLPSHINFNLLGPKILTPHQEKRTNTDPSSKYMERERETETEREREREREREKQREFKLEISLLYRRKIIEGEGPYEKACLINCVYRG